MASDPSFDCLHPCALPRRPAIDATLEASPLCTRRRFSALGSWRRLVALSDPGCAALGQRAAQPVERAVRAGTLPSRQRHRTGRRRGGGGLDAASLQALARGGAPAAEVAGPRGRAAPGDLSELWKRLDLSNRGCHFRRADCAGDLEVPAVRPLPPPQTG